MKKLSFLFVITFTIICLTGCGKNDVINTDSNIVVAKNQMLNNLKNYSYDVKITTKTGIVDVTTNMNCKDDSVNKIAYCYTSTMGVEKEEYLDYANQMDYTKVSTIYGNDGNNGKWTKTKLNGTTSNTWINLSDYIFNLTEESKNGGTYYTGTIDSKKLAGAMAQSDSNIDLNKIVSDDIDIEVFVNSSNYIETMNYSIEIMGIKEYVEISFKNFNTSGTIEIPSEVK